jgi:hypothetical protein
MSTDRRSKRMTFRLSQKEYQALNILSSRQNMGPAEFLRTLIRQSADREGIAPLALVELLSIGQGNAESES